MATSPAAKTPGALGLKVLVDEDPVVDREPGLGRELGARPHADADDDEVAVDHRPSLVRTRSTDAVALEGSTPVSISICDAVLAVEVAVDGAHLDAQHALERDGAAGR